MDNENMVTTTETVENVNNQSNGSEKTEKVEKTYTRDELNKILNAERTKLRDEILKEEEAKRTEAEKLAKMNAEEKNKYELEKERKAKEEALSKLNAYELKETALKIAKEKELDVSLLDVIDFSKETAETIKTKIETIDSVYKKAVEIGIKNGFKEETPRTVINNKVTKKNVSRASI